MRNPDRTCTTCHTAYPADAQHFYRKGLKLQAVCKACAKAARDKWRAEHREHVREYDRLWAQRNYDRRRASRVRMKVKAWLSFERV